jgi:hypothetical protein
MTPETFEIIDLPAGPRQLPSWVRDFNINWMWGWDNSPELKVRCRTDPLAFTKDDNPVWLPGDSAARDGQTFKPGTRAWIAEQDGVVTCHYHGGAITEQQFIRKIGGTYDATKPQLLDGQPWMDTAGLHPDQIANAKPKIHHVGHHPAGRVRRARV